MANGMNLLNQIFEKSWKLYDEQMREIAEEASAIYEWINQIVPAAEEAFKRKTVCVLPKTPSVKKRKIEKSEMKTQVESEGNENEEPALFEAKKPHQLKPRRNAKASTSKRLSKARRSKQNKKRTLDSIQPARVTRAASHKNTIDLSENAITDKGLRESNDYAASLSNSTKSFIEHEKDLESMAEKKKSDSLVVKMVDILLPIEDEDTKLPSNASSAATISEVQSEPSNHSGKVYVVSTPSQVKISGEEEKVGPEENFKVEDTVEKNEIPKEAANEVAVETKPEKDLGGIRDGKITEVGSPRTEYPLVQISKIKERLFEKINMPSSSTPTRQSPRLGGVRQSPRLAGGRQSPLLGKSPIRGDAQKRLDSPLLKQKEVERLKLEEEIKVTSNERKAEQEERCVDGDEGVTNEATKRKDAASGSCTGPRIIKPLKPKNLVTGVHSMIKAANQTGDIIHQGPVAKQGNIVTGLFSFIKPNTTDRKQETVQERKQRLEEESKRREQARARLVQQAEQRKQKEMEERKKRRQEREQRVAEVQAKKAQEEKERQEITQKRFEMMRKNEEKIRKNKEKEEEVKRKIREKKMAEAEAKRKQEENERLAKMADREEEEKRKAEYHQRKQEYEEMERKKKMEEQKKAEEQRLEEHTKEMQLHEERLRREIEEREAQVRKRLEEKEREAKERKRIEKEKEEQERMRKEAEEKEKEKLEKEKSEIERLEREKEEKLRIERELRERKKKEEAARERERKLEEEREAKMKEMKERKEKGMKLIKDSEIKDREAYYRKKLEQKQFAETKRTFDKAELEMKPALMKSPIHPAPHSKLQKCTSYHTPTLEKVKSKSKTKSPSLQNYDIDNLSEDDSTDDEEDPAQDIPSWAKGTTFKAAILAQIKSDVDPRQIFVNMLEPPKLEKMFPKLRARFFKRTSSACWDHPPKPFKTML